MSTLFLVLLSVTALPNAAALDESMGEGFPTRGQVTRYLEGKRVEGRFHNPFAGPEPEARTRSLLIKKGQIAAVGFGKGSSRENDEPWTTYIIFIVQTRHKRYAVEGVIRHTEVGADRAFYGFKVTRITEQ